MKLSLKEIDSKEAATINGGSWLYDAYRIIKEEGQDFIAGFKDGFNNGIF